MGACGFRRRGSGRGARYVRRDGRAVNGKDLARIRKLAIPPGWTDVRVNPSPTGLVQAIGRDRARRWQYRYHAAQVARRERRKQERLMRFLVVLPALRRTVAQQLRRPGLPRERVLAGTLRTLLACQLRPGGEVYAARNGSYGLATLRPRHVAVRGDLVRFDFRGKSKQRQQHEVRDRQLARLVRELLRHPGEVFKYEAANGALTDVRTPQLNAYVREVTGGDFSAKDFRTWAGTLLCACALARVPPATLPTARERRRHVAAMVREVAAHLGNTPAVCRASYVLDDVIRLYERGRALRPGLGDIRDLGHARRGSVERNERALLALLRKGQARGA